MKKKKVLWILTKSITNLKFAIFVLLVICVFSLIGSLIEQYQSLLYYKLILIESMFLFKHVQNYGEMAQRTGLFANSSIHVFSKQLCLKQI